MTSNNETRTQLKPRMSVMHTDDDYDYDYDVDCASDSDYDDDDSDKSITQPKPRMRFLLPHEIFYFRKPEPEFCEHMNDDYDKHSDSDSDSDSDSEKNSLQLIKPRMRVLLPHETFHFTKPEPESYEHRVDDDDDDEDDDNDDDDDYDADDDHCDSSLLVQASSSPKFGHFDQPYLKVNYPSNNSIATYEQDQECDSPQSDCFSLFLDDSIVTHHQDHDHDERYSGEPLSPPRSASYFDCNMCLKLAREPVVTSCGHLYCWPCLHSWLTFYSSQRECLVCKNKVFDSLITPICNNRDGISEFNVPPKPKGIRPLCI